MTKSIPENTALIKLDGTIIKKDGTQKKSDFFKFLDLQPEDYSHISYTPEEAKRVKRHLQYLSTGSASASPRICFLPDSRVVMADGTLKPIQEIEVGDRVYTHLGRARSVIKVFQHHTKEAVFSFRAGNYHTNQWTDWCTAEHPFYEPFKEDWIKAADLKRKDFLTIPFGSRKEGKLSDVDWAEATLLGFYIAEGSGEIGRRGKEGWLEGDTTTFTLNFNERDYEEEIRKASSILGFTQIHTYEKPEKNTRIIRIYGKEPIRTLVEWGGMYSNRKRFAEIVLSWSYEKKMVLLNSYLKGDGHYSPEKQGKTRFTTQEWEWKTVSKALSEQLYTLFVMLNILPSKPLYYDPPLPRKRTYYSSLSKPSLVMLDGITDYETNKYIYNLGEKGTAITIFDVRTKYYEGFVYNLEVEEDNSYCVNWIAVHNCGGLAKCSVAQEGRCPFVEIDKERTKVDPKAPKVTPLGLSCLVELNLLNEWTRNYVDEYEVSGESFTELQMCRELAEIELFLWRLKNNLARPENADLVEDTVVGIDKYGNILTRKETSAYFLTKEKLENRKSRLTKLMVGDRQEQYKRQAALKTQAETDPSLRAARLRTALTQLLLKTQGANTKIIDAELIELPEPTTPPINTPKVVLLDENDKPVEKTESKVSPDQLIDDLIGG